MSRFPVADPAAAPADLPEPEGEPFLERLALILKNKAPCQAISSEPRPCLLRVPREAGTSPVFINTH